MTTVVVGKITGVHGIRGWLKLLSYTANPEDVFDYKPWALQLKKHAFSAMPEEYKPFGKGFLVKLHGYDTPELAKNLVNAEIIIERSQLPDLPDEQHYWVDLIGFTVETTQGVALGKITHFFETGANDVFVVKDSKEHLIPYVLDHIVKHIDPIKKHMLVEWDPDF